MRWAPLTVLVKPIASTEMEVMTVSARWATQAMEHSVKVWNMVRDHCPGLLIITLLVC